MNKQASVARKPKNNKSKSRRQSKVTIKESTSIRDPTTVLRMRENMKTSIAPVAIASEQKFPYKGYGRRKSHRFTNSEEIATVNGAVTFTVIRFPVNPGLPGTFPYLNQEANRWEQYRFHYLRFRYITRTSTSTVGSVILSPDYNVRDPIPATEQQATNTQDAVENVAWKEICTELDVGAMFSLGSRKLIRTGNIAGDTNLYDAANLHLCVLEEANTNAIGKLWIDYDVEFFVPQNSPPETASALNTSFGGQAAQQALTTNTLAILQFDPLTVDPLMIGSPTSGVFTPLAGTYFITVDTTIKDSSAESLTGTIQVLKNGVALVPSVNSGFLVTVPAGGFVSPSLNGIVSVNGTDTISISVLAVGAAGTLTIPADSSYITFRPT